MKAFFLVLIFLMSSVSTYAESTSNDFGQISGQTKPMTVQELQMQLQVDGDVYGVDSQGNHVLFRGGEHRQWRFNGSPHFQSNWSVKVSDFPQIAIVHKWVVSPDGQIKTNIRQYDSMTPGRDDKEVKLGKLIREEDKVIKDLAPITWNAVNKDGTQLVVRFVPSIREKEDPEHDISDFPITGSHIVIFDNQGRTWTEPIDNIGSKYVAFTTFRGQIAVSYYQFPGSKKIGTAKGNVMELEPEKNLKIRFSSGTPFLPGEMSANVYGRYDSAKKTSRLSSTHIMTSNKELRFLEALGLAGTLGGTSEKISFKAYHMGVKDALVSLGRHVGKKFDLSNEVTNDDIVQMDVKDVEWTEALQFLLDEGHLESKIKKDGTVAISRKSTF